MWAGRWEAGCDFEEGKNGDIMLLLRKFLKSSFKESVVYSKWSAF